MKIFWQICTVSFLDHCSLYVEVNCSGEWGCKIMPDVTSVFFAVCNWSCNYNPTNWWHDQTVQGGRWWSVTSLSQKDTESILLSNGTAHWRIFKFGNLTFILLFSPCGISMFYNPRRVPVFINFSSYSNFTLPGRVFKVMGSLLRY